MLVSENSFWWIAAESLLPSCYLYVDAGLPSSPVSLVWPWISLWLHGKKLFIDVSCATNVLWIAILPQFGVLPVSLVARATYCVSTFPFDDSLTTHVLLV